MGGRFGARLEGIDFARPLGEAEIEAIASALHEHQVLSLPATAMTPEQHLQIALRFGTPEEQQTDQFSRHESVPHITVIDSEKGDRADSWHCDETFLEHPPVVNLLHGMQMPEAGGDTAFMSAACAYEALSDKFKTLVEGLTAIHDYGHLYELGWRAGLPLGPAVGNALQKGLIHEHPVVKTHPVTGRKWLSVNSTYTRHILGIEPLEAQSLLDFLLRHMQKPEFQFRHHWQEGDLLLWDQQAVQHYAVNDFEGRRLVHRIATLANAETYTGIKA
jgi:taurine dioxygenase